MKKTHSRLIGSIYVILLLLIAAASVSMSQQLRQDSLDYSLIKAVRSLDASRVETRLSEGANPNAYDNMQPPLTIASLIARLRIRLQGASKQVDCDAGVPVLVSLLQDPRLIRSWYARRVETFDVIATALVRHNANVNIHGRHLKPLDSIEGRDYAQLISEATPLHLASLFRMRRTVNVLLSRGADTNARNGAGDTPLAFADTDTALLLIQHGANVNARHCGGETLLTRAILCCNLDMVKILIRFGADLNLANDVGHSPLYVGRQYHDMGEAGIVPFLTKHGARLNSTEKPIQAKRIKRNAGQ